MNVNNSVNDHVDRRKTNTHRLYCVWSQANNWKTSRYLFRAHCGPSCSHSPLPDMDLRHGGPNALRGAYPQRPECAIFFAKSWYEDVLVPSDYPSIFARKAAHSGRSLCSLESPPRRICVLQHIMSKCLTPESPKIALMDHTLPLTMSVTFVTIRYTQLHGDWCRVSSTRTVREQFVCSCSFVHVRSR